MSHVPFARFRAIMAVIGAAVAGGMSLQLAMAEHGAGYASRGKRKTRTHDRGGTRAAQRAAVKLRNQKRHRAHLKGR